MDGGLVNNKYFGANYCGANIGSLRNVLTSQVQSRSSHSWQSISKSFHILTPGLQWSIAPSDESPLWSFD